MAVDARPVIHKRVPRGHRKRTCRGQPVADPNRMSGTFFTRVASVLPT